MRQVVLPRVGTVPAWRAEARRLAGEGVPADQVLWQVGGEAADLFAGAPTTPGAPRALRLPRAAVEGIEEALCHSDPERFARAYAVLLRLADGTLHWGDRSDPAMKRLMEEGKAVARDVHKMHAFVRFRDLGSDTPRRRFGAWFEPEHVIVERAAPFFANRFGDMDWVIATPTLTATFIAGALSFAETTDRDAPPEDAAEDLWRTYYASIFNAARLMVKAMQAEMPKKYWANLPEAALIPGLIQGAEARVAEMAARAATDPPARRTAAARAMAMPEKEMPMEGTLDEVRAEARACTRCPLYAPATQTVFGEGPPDAPLMIVGEQPGDQEDLAGRPFVGPAGQMFDAEAEAAGLDRSPRLCHQRGEALQVRAARQAAHPPAPRPARDRRLPLVARPRAAICEAEADPRHGGDRARLADRQGGGHPQAPRRDGGGARRHAAAGHDPSELHPARARCGGAGRGAAELPRRPRQGRGVHPRRGLTARARGIPPAPCHVTSRARGCSPAAQHHFGICAVISSVILADASCGVICAFATADIASSTIWLMRGPFWPGQPNHG